MADPLGGDQFDVETLAEAEIEKLLKQVSFTFWVDFFSI
jgi:hypothetical protein